LFCCRGEKGRKKDFRNGPIPRIPERQTLKVSGCDGDDTIHYLEMSTTKNLAKKEKKISRDIIGRHCKTKKKRGIKTPPEKKWGKKTSRNGVVRRKELQKKKKKNVTKIN